MAKPIQFAKFSPTPDTALGTDGATLTFNYRDGGSVSITQYSAEKFNASKVFAALGQEVFARDRSSIAYATLRSAGKAEHEFHKMWGSAVAPAPDLAVAA